MPTEEAYFSIGHSFNQPGPVGSLPFAHSSLLGVKSKPGMGIVEVKF